MARELELIDLEAWRLSRKVTKKELAGILGITETTLRGYFENRWTVLDRMVFERMADFFECSIADLLITRESSFFEAFGEFNHEGCDRRRGMFLAVRRPDANVTQIGRTVAYRDDAAIHCVSKLLEAVFQQVVVPHVTTESPEQFEKHSQENCVVVGSPMVNRASEIAFCRLFGATPFDSSECDKLPFLFQSARATTNHPSSVVQRALPNSRGIWIRKSNELIEADYWPPDEFYRKRVDKGRDCGVVAVMNRTNAEGQRRKLVVLSGFSGVGTEAAAQALSQHYRDLEPRNGATSVWGVIEVFYRKKAGSSSRDLLGYNWRYRAGGRCPLDAGQKAPYRRDADGR